MMNAAAVEQMNFTQQLMGWASELAWHFPFQAPRRSMDRSLFCGPQMPEGFCDFRLSVLENEPRPDLGQQVDSLAVFDIPRETGLMVSSARSFGLDVAVPNSLDEPVHQASIGIGHAHRDTPTVGPKDGNIPFAVDDPSDVGRFSFVQSVEGRLLNFRLAVLLLIPQAATFIAVRIATIAPSLRWLKFRPRLRQVACGATLHTAIIPHRLTHCQGTGRLVTASICPFGVVISPL